MAINFGNYGKTGTYETFVAKMVENQVGIIMENSSYAARNNNITAMDYFTTLDNKMKIKICPEPSIFLKQITKYDTSSKRQEAFSEFIADIEESTVKKPNNNVWFNKTSNGINIRLGNVEGDTGNQEPATLGDDCVHGVVVGRTGAGKSVLINNIILNLTTEYAPWELDLFLVDMKKVELSRYMANAEDGSFLTPHVSACGATSEVKYVVSMIQYLSDCMKARQALFAALGIQKIKDFREKYSKECGVDFVLPRILLLVDEFQQMFLEASSKERRILDECITAITKLGRATGVHLLFASQEMSGALGSKELANFKLRIALPCDASISEQILGNSAAAKIEEKGITLVNKKGGSKAEDNIMYKTPFIDDKESEDGELSEFQRYLLDIHNVALETKFKKVQKFYQEDTQDKMYKIEMIKNNEKVQEQIQSYIQNNPAIIDAFILGTGVLYSNKKNDYESFFMEKGKKRNVGILCAKDGDIGNTLKTLVDNFVNSSVRYAHTVIYESEILRSAYTDLVLDLEKNSHSVEEVNFQDYYYGTRKNLSAILSKLNYTTSYRELYLEFIVKYIAMLTKSEIEAYLLPDFKKLYNDKTFLNEVVDTLKILPEMEEPDGIMQVVETLKNRYTQLMNQLNAARIDINSMKENAEMSTQALKIDSNIQVESMVITVLLQVLCQFLENHKLKNDNLVQYYKVFVESIQNQQYMGAIHIVWLIGTDNIDKGEDRNLSKIMETCTNNGEIYILAGANPENLETSFRCCNYLFINSEDEKLYNKYKMSFTKKGDDNKTMDFKIINYNQERSYKQLLFECKVGEAPKLDFEEIEV